MSARVDQVFHVKLDASCYDLVLGRSVIEQELTSRLGRLTESRDVLVVYDAYFDAKVLAEICTPLRSMGFRVVEHAMPARKHNKTIHEAMKIFERLESESFSRDATLIAIGGGVIGDLAGFVASTYFRGMNLVHIPTTMTAMIDSCIGGKVAINFRKTINAIGNYYHPIVTIIDLAFLDSLPDRDVLAGLAEIIKCAIIADENLFAFRGERAESILARSEQDVVHVMTRAIEIKLAHVTGDVAEKGKRLKLNYGHTLGHAIEVSTSVLEEVFRHGEGVALGMVGAAYLAVDLGVAEADLLARHRQILSKYKLPVGFSAAAYRFQRDTLIRECLSTTYKDKKRMNSKLRLILASRIGCCSIYDHVSESQIKGAFEYLIEE